MTLGKIRHADVPFLWPLPAEFFKSAQWALYVVRRDSAVKLVDDLAGESPASANCPVGTVVVSGDGAGDQAVGSPDVNALDGWT